ncbi:GP46-like surface antigen, putative [Bodo saltans]|uniref:GP46-like surface antigen, putative n=1 Tax=Bodo saltans TaxID=75058 RepID=A0A0S4JN05_BODSA|nr:GP46-like surface antigen, putative [Bodo saltans]|eukprot:CUG92915.1 GP46-like surface antigen, putative [Bodo saltans]
MSKLQWLTINSNRLSGPLPESWGTMTKFTRLTIFSNSLNGTLPASWDTMSGLQTLTMSNNSLSGTLPPSWGNMPILQTLSLDSNSLNGTLPDSWATMPKLQALNIDSNSLGGTLPSSWGTMPSLATLSLNVNSLSGTLPASWNSISLTALSLGSNIFNGTLPASWSSMFRLTSLALNFNDLNGTLPASWNSMWDLQTLYLNSNSLSGTLPASWDSMFSLASLALNFNSLNGTLPASWSTMSRLTTLSLASNSLSGSLPASWGGMSRLQTLDISSNALEGTIPAQWSQMGYQMVSANQSLRVRLNLSVSFLNGSVPASFAQNNGSKPCLNIFSTHISSKFSSRNVWNCNWSSFYNIAVPTSSHTLSPPASFSTTADRSDAEISTTNVTSSSSSISATVPLVVGIRSPPAITVKSLAQIASGVGAALAVIAAAPSNGFAINRLATLSNLGDCSDAVRQTVEGVMTDGIPTLLDAPLQLSFGDEFGASQRGSVLGNLLVLIIVGFVSVGAVVVHRCVNGIRPRAILSHRGLFLKSAATLRLPGSMVISVVLLLDVLVTSSVLLVSYGVHVSDAVLGVAALLVVSVVFFGTCFVLDPRTLSFQAVALHVRQIAICDKLVPTQSVRVRIAALWDHITSPSNEWETRKLQRKGNPLFVEHYGHLFEGCRGGRHWWILVEASTTIIVSMLRSVVPETEAACVTRAWIALALVSVVLVALIAAWPMNTHVETGASIALSGAQVVVIACAIGGVGDVADVIGLTVSISSAALALLPIALWMTSFLSWECRNKKTPHSVVPCEMRPLSLTQMLHKIKSTHSVVSNCSELDTTTVALRVIIELICDLSHFE